MRLTGFLIKSINDSIQLKSSIRNGFLRLKNKMRLFFPLQQRKESELEKLAQHWVDELEAEAFDRLKKDIFRVVIFTFYKKKSQDYHEDEKDPESNHEHEDEIELSVYDIAQNEWDLVKLNQLNDECWRRIIKEMVTGSLEILQVFDQFPPSELKQMTRLKVALINIPVLRRATFKII